jgi:NAD(P)-dependent dehydrogenase (short-subunit alcohol dehydrogenase family)
MAQDIGIPLIVRQNQIRFIGWGIRDLGVSKHVRHQQPHRMAQNRRGAVYSVNIAMGAPSFSPYLLPLMPTSLPRTLIITGASRGIGAAIALKAARSEYLIAVNYANDQQAAARVVDEIHKAGGNAISIRADVSVESEIIALFQEAEGRLGPIYGLVNNAGITGGFARIDETSRPQLERLMAVNVIGPILCSREAVKRMSTRYGHSGGSIVNISSLAARTGGAGEWVHYAATKGAIDTLTIGLAREVANEGIRVNAVSPGLIETGLHSAAGAPDRPIRLSSSIPMKRPGTADEIAAGVLWLLSSEASYVTGTILEIGGGR